MEEDFLGPRLGLSWFAFTHSDSLQDVQPGEDADGDGSNEKSWEIIEWAAAKAGFLQVQ